MKRALVLGAASSLAIHLVLGWAWTVLAGIVAGLFVMRLRGLAGGLAVGLAWCLFIGYSFAVAPAPAERMVTVTGGIFAGLPGFMVIFSTLLIGVSLGTAGGLLCKPLLQIWNWTRINYVARRDP